MNWGNQAPLQLAVKLQQLHKDVSRGGDVRHTNSDVFETGRQTQAWLQLFRSKRGSRHNRPNFLFKWRVPNGRLQGLGVFNLDPDKAGENEHGKELILQLSLNERARGEKKKKGQKEQKTERKMIQMFLWSFYNLLFTGNSKAISDQYVLNTGSWKIVPNLIQTHRHRSSVGLWINVSDKQKCTVYHITLNLIMENLYKNYRNVNLKLA